MEEFWLAIAGNGCTSDGISTRSYIIRVSDIIGNHCRAHKKFGLTNGKGRACSCGPVYAINGHFKAGLVFYPEVFAFSFGAAIGERQVHGDSRSCRFGQAQTEHDMSVCLMGIAVAHHQGWGRGSSIDDGRTRFATHNRHIRRLAEFTDKLLSRFGEGICG